MSLRAQMGGWTLVVLVALALPATAAPISGELTVGGPAQLSGDITWSGDTRMVDLRAEDGVPAYQLDLSAARAHIHVSRETWTGTEDQVFGDANRQDGGYRETVATGVSLRELALMDDARIIIAGESLSGIAHTTAAELRAAESIYHSVDPHDSWRTDHALLPYSVAEQDQIVATTDGLDFEARASFMVSFWNARVAFDTDEGLVEMQAGYWVEEGGTPLVVDDTHVKQVIWVEVTGGKVQTDWAGRAALAGAAPRIDVNGILTMPTAAGSLLVDALGLAPEAQDVEIRGELALAPRADPDASQESQTPRDPERYYESFQTGVRGDADSVTLAGAAIVQDDTGIDAVAAGAAGLGLLGVIYGAYRFAPLAVAALYSRLEEGELLKNETRAQIYQIVCKNPGISARQIHRLSSASWGTVVHHLGKLASAGYVATRSHGRAKCYYENHGKWDQYQEQLAVLTGDKTSAIAEAIASVPGRDQSQIVARTGFSQSTVSYHLLKLENANLVSKERSAGSLAYFPTADLRAIMARLEVVGAAPAGTPAGGAA